MKKAKIIQPLKNKRGRKSQEGQCTPKGDKKKAEELRRRGEDTNKPGPLGNQKNLEKKPGFDYESYGEGDAHTGDNNPHRNEGEEDLLES